ncbi:MAG: IS110 family transposase [Planctomycetota bacterium]
MRSVEEKVGEDKMVFCGIDVHRESMMVATAVGRGEIAYQRYGTTDEEVARLAEEVRRLGEEVHAVYEASGEGFRLSDSLEEEGFRVTVVAPTEVERSVRHRRRKTDKEDARRLVKLVRSAVLAGGDLPAVWVPDKELRDEREIVRRRLQLGEELTRTKNRIHGLLRRWGVRRPKEIRTLWTEKHVAWLRELVGTLEEWASRTLASLLRQVEFLFEERDRLDADLSELAARPRYKGQVAKAQTVPGVGELTAMVFLTEMGDPQRFRNRREVGSWMGLTPRSYESGEATDRKGHISRLGPARVRKVLNQAAWALVRTSERAGRWFAYHTAGRNKGRKTMIVALMRKMGILLWHQALAA